jgi:hypothetical protein
MAESRVATVADAEYDLLLLAARFWRGRYAIPSGPLPAAVTDVLRVQLGAPHVLAADARIMLAPWLFSLEQIRSRSPRLSR